MIRADKLDSFCSFIVIEKKLIHLNVCQEMIIKKNHEKYSDVHFYISSVVFRGTNLNLNTKYSEFEYLSTKKS